MPISSNKRNIQKTNRFGRDIRHLPTNVQEYAFQAATKLSENIFDSSLKFKRMTGLPGVYRVVILHDYRMVYSFDDKNIYLLRIAHRREIYKGLEL